MSRPTRFDQLEGLLQELFGLPELWRDGKPRQQVVLLEQVIHSTLEALRDEIQEPT